MGAGRSQACACPGAAGLPPGPDRGTAGSGRLRAPAGLREHRRRGTAGLSPRGVGSASRLRGSPAEPAWYGAAASPQDRHRQGCLSLPVPAEPPLPRGRHRRAPAPGSGGRQRQRQRQRQRCSSPPQPGGAGAGPPRPSPPCSAPRCPGIGAAGLPGARRGLGRVLIYLFVSFLFFVIFFATPPGLNLCLSVNSGRRRRRMGRGRRRRAGGRAGAGAPLRSPAEQRPLGRQVPAGCGRCARRPREQ